MSGDVEYRYYGRDFTTGEMAPVSRQDEESVVQARLSVKAADGWRQSWRVEEEFEHAR